MNKYKMVLIWGAFLIFSIPMAFAQDKTSVTSQPERLTLENCLELAAANNQDLKAAAKEIVIAQTKVKEAEGNFRPKLDYSVFANQAEDPVYPYPKPIFPYPSKELSGGSLSLTQPLYQGGKLSNQLKIAQAQLKMALENEQKAKQQLTFQVKEAFYQVWLTEQLQNTAQASYDNLVRHVRKVNELYQAGTASRFETLRAKVQCDSLKPQVISTQNHFKLAQLNLGTLMGFPRDRQYFVNIDVKNIKIPDKLQIELQQILDTAYQARPEIHQIKLTLETNGLQLKMAEANTKPNIAIVGKYQGQSMDYSPSNWLDNKSWSCALSITGNIYDGSVTSYKIKSAQENQELSGIQEKKLHDQIRLEVEQTVQRNEESLETIHANQANIDFAKETLELTQVRFDAGMATTMDVMDAQLAVDKALNGYYQGLADYLTAQARLDLVCGRDSSANVSLAAEKTLQ